MTTSSMEFDESPLFDVDLSLDELFVVPTELQEFDRGITDDEIEVNGRAAFVGWLTARLKNQLVTTPAPPFTTACEEEATMPDANLAMFGEIKVRANFFPEHPDPEDFQDGEANLEYRRQVHNADLGTAYAKIACDSCPIRKECLTSSIVNFEEYGVWGGWSAGARSYIHDHFKSLRKAYISFEKSQTKPEFDETSEDFKYQLEYWAGIMASSKDELKESAQSAAATVEATTEVLVAN